MTHWAGPGVVQSYSQDYGHGHDKSSEVKREIQSAIAGSANGRHKHQQTSFEHTPNHPLLQDSHCQVWPCTQGDMDDPKKLQNANEKTIGTQEVNENQPFGDLQTCFFFVRMGWHSKAHLF